MIIDFMIQTAKCYGIRDSFGVFPSAANYLFHKYILQRKVIERRVYDYRMYLDLYDRGISKTLALVGKRELEHRYILEKELARGMTVMDIGANIGYYVLMESRIIGKTGKVYAIEPSPSNCELLRKNVHLNDCNGIVEIFQAAVSNKTGEAEFFLSDLSNLNTFHPKLFRGSGKSKNVSGESIMVKTIDIAGFIQDKQRIDLVRMDIEGHEVEVFESIIKAVKERKFSAKILFETHFNKYDDTHHNMRKQLIELFETGYTPKIMASSDETKAKFMQKGYLPDKIIKTDFVERGIYSNVKKDDAISFICDIGGVRTVLLEKV